MAQQSAVQFLNDIESDSSLRSDVMPHFDYDTGQWNADGVLDVAKHKGYDFTRDELKAASEDIYGGELSDEQLEMISGGGCCCSCTIMCCCCCGG